MNLEDLTNEELLEEQKKDEVEQLYQCVSYWWSHRSRRL